MAKARIWLTKISAQWEFLVNKPKLVFDGDALELGSPFDKSLVSTRRLRQLYESRRIIKDDERSPEVVKTQTPAPVPVAPIVVKQAAPEPVEEIPFHMPRIEKTARGGWYKIIASGKQIGKTTRDLAVAEKWRDNYANEI